MEQELVLPFGSGFFSILTLCIQTIPKDATIQCPPINVALFEAKAAKGLTFDQIAREIGKDEVWLAAAFYGQV